MGERNNARVLFRNIRIQQPVRTLEPFAIAERTAQRVDPLEDLLQGARFGGMIGSIAGQREARNRAKLEREEFVRQRDRQRRIQDIANQSVTVNAETGRLELDPDNLKAGLLAGGEGMMAFEMEKAEEARAQERLAELFALRKTQAETAAAQALAAGRRGTEGRAAALGPVVQQQAEQALAQSQAMAPLKEQLAQAQLRSTQAQTRTRRAQARAAERESTVPKALRNDKDLQRVIFTQFGGEMTPTNVGLAQQVLQQERQGQKEAELRVSQQVKRQFPILNAQQQRSLGSTNTKLAVADTMAQDFTPAEIDKWVGFLKGRANRIAQLARQNERFAEFQSLVGRLRASILFDRQEGGGGALTPTELQALEVSIPTGLERGGAPEFRAKLRQMQTILRTSLETQTRLPSMTPQQAQVFLAGQRERLRRGFTSSEDIDQLISEHSR